MPSAEPHLQVLRPHGRQAGAAQVQRPHLGHESEHGGGDREQRVVRQVEVAGAAQAAERRVRQVTETQNPRESLD